MRIVIFNWRDIKNPKAGGAELVTHQIAKAYVSWGHSVTLVTASFKGALAEETLDGVRVIRLGNQLSVHWRAFRYYEKNLKGKIDLVVDEINTLPFFTPLYVKERKVAYFNQLAREVWFYEAKLPFSLLGYLLEPLYLRLYRKTKVMTISQSTKNDLVKLGFEDVSIFSMAIDFAAQLPYLEPKEKNLTLIFVGRMVKSKRPDETIRALAVIKQKIPDVKLQLVGGGEESFIKSLRVLAEDLGVAGQVEFKGFVKQADKFRLMSRAHLIVVTSIREGWGLIVTEANALKTPAVVYDVPGLRDAVQNHVTGLVVTPNPTSLAEGILSLWGDKEKYRHFQEAGYKWSRQLTWDRTAQESFNILEKA